MLTATYIIASTFRVTGRGLVLAGYIESGTISVGNWVVFEALGVKRKRRILAIEGIRTALPDIANTGMMIQCTNEQEIEELRNWSPNNEVGSIVEHNEKE